MYLCVSVRERDRKRESVCVWRKLTVSDGSRARAVHKEVEKIISICKVKQCDIY